jgi:hypothetical protein
MGISFELEQPAVISSFLCAQFRTRSSWEEWVRRLSVVLVFWHRRYSTLRAESADARKGFLCRIGQKKRLEALCQAV